MTDGVNTRIVLLRKKLNLTQSQFAEKIGLKFSAISMIELGKTPVTEVNIKAICYSFSVREDWLRLGSGEMFDCLHVRNTVEALAVEAFRRLSPELKESIITHASCLAAVGKGWKEDERYI